MMKSNAYKTFEKYTSDKKLPMIEVLEARREEVYQIVKELRDSDETKRWQGIMSELDLQIHYLKNS
ncbi:hypothetical protein HPC38_02275 [Pasteurellaceae bacterium HPA106]|uniref:hypothetical protein n=1 Tax=Spirabiliibacterium pneumoniae TaxID=221400 RepID=UPI001AACC976|nr:hypothetical protein [Spirabiliibacterium pneumoniae]MBE2895705.1 hypothetical protein [Spirabiliibacterium pneumoniae]